MQRAGHQLLAGPCLTRDKDRDARVGHLTDLIKELPDDGTHAQDCACRTMLVACCEYAAVLLTADDVAKHDLGHVRVEHVQRLESCQSLVNGIRTDRVGDDEDSAAPGRDLAQALSRRFVDALFSENDT